MIFVGQWLITKGREVGALEMLEQRRPTDLVLVHTLVNFKILPITIPFHVSGHRRR